MKKTIFAVSALSLALAACSSTPSSTTWAGAATDSHGANIVDSVGECIVYGAGKVTDCVAAPKKEVIPANGELYTLSAGVLFAFDSAELTSAGMAEVDKVITNVSAVSGVSSVSVVGHTDSRGSEAYNQALSERRAATVAAYMQAKGVGNVSTAGQGELNPVADNATAAGRQANRRVEVFITGEK